MRTITRTKAVELINETKGKFFTVTFIKKNGEERTINGNRKTITKMGYITMSVPKVGYKNIDPRTIRSLRISKVEYRVR